MLTITVIGMPGPQGSKKLIGRDRKGRGILVESSAKVKPWREAVKWAALQFALDKKPYVPGPLACGAVSVEMAFTLPRPKSARRNAVPDKRPDLSKLVRSTEDALTDAGAWEDDARVVRCMASKHYVGDFDALASPGAVIKIRPLERAK